MRVEDQCLFIRNTSPHAFSAGSIEFSAELDKGQYIGSRSFSDWELGGEIEIVIAPPRDMGRLKKIKLTGHGLAQSSPDSKLSFTPLKFATTFDPPVRIEFKHAAPWFGASCAGRSYVFISRRADDFV